MFNESPDILWNAVFNVPQGATMTIAVSLFLHQADFVTLKPSCAPTAPA